MSHSYKCHCKKKKKYLHFILIQQPIRVEDDAHSCTLGVYFSLYTNPERYTVHTLKRLLFQVKPTFRLTVLVLKQEVLIITSNKSEIRQD